MAVRDPAAMTDVRLPEAAEAAVTVRCHLDNPSAVRRDRGTAVRIAPDGFAGTAGRDPDQSDRAAARADGSRAEARRRIRRWCCTSRGSGGR